MRLWIVVGALNGFLAVALGAFAAHGLRGRVPEAAFAAFETGARYHQIHALAMIAAGVLVALGGRGMAHAAAIAFLAGALLFSGSLYHYGLTGSRSLVLITPFGGAAFLAGWLLLALAGLRLSPG